MEHKAEEGGRQERRNGSTTIWRGTRYRPLKLARHSAVNAQIQPKLVDINTSFSYVADLGNKAEYKILPSAIMSSETDDTAATTRHELKGDISGPQGHGNLTNTEPVGGITIPQNQKRVPQNLRFSVFLPQRKRDPAIGLSHHGVGFEPSTMNVHASQENVLASPRSSYVAGGVRAPQMLFVRHRGRSRVTEEV